MKTHATLHKRLMTATLAVGLVAATTTAILPAPAQAAACTPPGTDYGTVTYSASITSAGSYRIWTRMAAPDASTNTILLEVDGNTCFTVGGSTVPVYAGGSSTYFTNNKANWINVTSGGATVSHTFTSGSHTIKLIGNGADVVVDRVVITGDTTCVPTGTGDNCAMQYFAPDIDMNGSVNFIDFSKLASKYNQTSSLGRTDINNDGVVNFLDYSALASRYGQ